MCWLNPLLLWGLCVHVEQKKERRKAKDEEGGEEEDGAKGGGGGAGVAAEQGEDHWRFQRLHA